MHGLQKCLWVMIKRQKLLSFSLFIKILSSQSPSSLQVLKSKHMDSRLCFFVLALQIVSFVSGTSRPFPSNDGVGFNQQGQRAESLKALLGSNLDSLMDSKQGIKSKGVVAMEGLKEKAYYTKGQSKIGSSPPSCENKCYGCTPCEAIQVPTTNKNHNHLGVNYANYEPEGWKCKCGPSFYSP